MPWQTKVNRVLERVAGVQIRRAVAPAAPRVGGGGPAPAAGSRLVPSPIFILCAVRSGSTLLRVMLNGHPDLHAPHELHLRRLRVKEQSASCAAAMRESGFTSAEVEYLLWDRILHRHLQLAGKAHIVEKTPNNVLMWRRLVECWPQARFVFLLRHPWATVLSWDESHPDLTTEESITFTLRYMNAVEAARRELSGLTVRYEDLVTDPALVTRQVCGFAGVDWAPGMIDYGSHHRAAFKRGLGDWSTKIRSGAVQPPRPVPAGPVPERLQAICRAWGYRSDDSPGAVEHPAADCGSAAVRRNGDHV